MTRDRRRIDNGRDRSVDRSTRDHHLPLSERASLGLLFTRIFGGFSACLPISTRSFTREEAQQSIPFKKTGITSRQFCHGGGEALSLSLSLSLIRNYYCRSIVLAKIRTSSANLPAHSDFVSSSSSSSCSDVRSRRYSASFPCFVVFSFLQTKFNLLFGFSRSS